MTATDSSPPRGRTMRAVVVLGPGDARVDHVPIPDPARASCSCGPCAECANIRARYGDPTPG